MKKIYIGHSKKLDYKNDLYIPLRESALNDKYEIILPHEESAEPFNSREGLKECSAMVAEVSYPATGLGIELSWAHSYGIPIICIYKKGQKISGSLKVLSPKFIEYENSKDIISQIGRVLTEALS
jgi:hypothetical protein